MGKNLIQQARGKGSPRYRAPSFKYAGKIKFSRSQDKIKGEIKDLIHSRGHNAPLMNITYENGEEILLPAAEEIRVGDIIINADRSSLTAGSVLALGDIPDGTSVYNIESRPGDGGKFVRSSGTFAKVDSKQKDEVFIQLPSGKKKSFNKKCRACVGIIAGSGRKEKPFLKAGFKYRAMKKRNKLWPSVSGTSMNAVDHPFGGSSSSIKGRPTQSSRNAPPGRKVGKIAPRKTGKKR